MTHAWKKVLAVGGIAIATIGAAAATSVGSADSGDVAAAAAVDMFLKIEGIEGESMDKQHPKEIQVFSYTFGATRTGGVQTGERSGSVSIQDISITKRTDRASPKLFEAATLGNTYKQAVLSLRNAGTAAPVDFLRYTLSDISVTAYQTSAASETPTENISLKFGSVKVEYIVLDAKGGAGPVVSATYDTRANVRQ